MSDIGLFAIRFVHDSFFFPLDFPTSPNYITRINSLDTIVSNAQFKHKFNQRIIFSNGFSQNMNPILDWSTEFIDGYINWVNQKILFRDWFATECDNLRNNDSRFTPVSINLGLLTKIIILNLYLADLPNVLQLLTENILMSNYAEWGNSSESSPKSNFALLLDTLFRRNTDVFHINLLQYSFFCIVNDADLFKNFLNLFLRTDFSWYELDTQQIHDYIHGGHITPSNNIKLVKDLLRLVPKRVVHFMISLEPNFNPNRDINDLADDYYRIRSQLLQFFTRLK